MTVTPGAIRITDVRTVGVPVSDQDRALAFYADTLGFATRMDGSFGGGRWIEVAPEGATTSIALVAPAEGSPTGVPPMFSFRDPDGNTLYVVEMP
jgi:catechol 2,3-dioxygenase-like lactoylglutathione lyase family enzyme